MATVYVDEGGSSDIYRIERVYLDPDEAQRFTRDYQRYCSCWACSVEV